MPSTDRDAFLVVLIIIVVIALLICTRKDGLLVQPSGDTAEKLAKELVEKRYGMTDYSTARKVFPWMDPVAYESVRGVVRTGGYDVAGIAEALRT